MSTSFDPIAQNYDANFTDTSIGREQREIVHTFLNMQIPAPADILEINCGTGEDALKLATDGHSVLFTDASPVMVELAMQKTEPVRSLATGRVWDLRTPFPGDEKFDVIFSDFGGLNCLSPEELRKLSQQLAALLLNKGQIFAVVMGRKCWWERSYFLMTGKFRKIFRRSQKKPVTARLNAATTLPIWYYSPGEFARLFSNEFTAKPARPVGFFIPPSYLENKAKKFPGIFQLLVRCEKLISRMSFFADRADHYFIALEKR